MSVDAAPKLPGPVTGDDGAAPAPPIPAPPVSQAGASAPSSGALQARPRAGSDPRSDEELMSAYRAGDARAFRALVERHHGPVYRFCLRALRSPEAAADAAQEVFLRVVRNAAGWEPRAKFTTWVYTIARNHCIDEARKGRFRKTESLNDTVGKDGEGDERIERVPSALPASDDVTHGRRLRTAVDSALAQLPDEQREVFVLREVSGLAFKDIAEAVGVNENTVKSRMRYALGTLRKLLKGQGFDDTA